MTRLFSEYHMGHPFFVFGGTCICICLFRVNITGLRKWVTYRQQAWPSHFEAEEGVVKNCFTLWADPSLKIAKWNLIWAVFFHLQVCEKHSVCLCIWILSPSTCLGFDFLTYSLAAFLLQCSVHCVVSHPLVSVSYLIPHVLPGNARLTACFP